jgi:predicted short-subunit dehydrogenase-like oxidoreductase (DUF2520 family)
MTPSRQRALVIALIGIGLLVVGFFGLRTFRSFRDFHGHRPPPFAPAAADQNLETDVELIRDWMTIGFVSHTYRTPPRLLYDALGIPPKDNEKKSLKELNDEFFPDQPDHVLTVVKAAVQASLPSPTAIPADTVIPPATVPPAAP